MPLWERGLAGFLKVSRAEQKCSVVSKVRWTGK